MTDTDIGASVVETPLSRSGEHGSGTWFNCNFVYEYMIQSLVAYKPFLSESD